MLQPIAPETPQERRARLEQEALAQMVSDAIDEQLRKEKAEKAKRRPEVRILLLGMYAQSPLRPGHSLTLST
jgi:guanine nucleotide-binding protein subunit alpha